MSTSNEGIGYRDLVLIAYGWSCDELTTDLPGDIVALCPVDLCLHMLPRATGFIHRKPVPKEFLSAPPADLATAVTFFRITATVEQTRQLSDYGEWPARCQRGTAMVTWTLLSGISFHQLNDARVIEKGLCAALRDFRATELLRAVAYGLNQCRQVYLRGHEKQGKRRRLNQDCDMINAALSHIGAAGGNALGQPPPPMQPLADTTVAPKPFHTALAMSNDCPRVAPLHLGDLAVVDVATACAKVRRQVVAKAGEAIHTGRAIAPRTGIVFPSATRGQPDLANHPRRGCPKTSKVLLDVIGSELPPGLRSRVEIEQGRELWGLDRSAT